MRWLNELFRSERGATSVFVGLLMVPLIGFVAISLDVGALYAERAQLQNGADAAALSIAQDCAAGGTCTVASSAVLAKSYAQANANDGSANVLTPVFGTTPLGARTVEVTSSTLDAGGAVAMEHPFAALLGATATTVHAKATAEWGPPREGPIVLPLAISLCEFRPALDGTLQLIRYDIHLVTCPGRDGHPIPGGFGWLERAAGCSAYIDADLMVPSDPGNDYPNSPACDLVMASLAGKTILIPIFDDADTNAGGAVASYHVYGFAAFTVVDWKFAGGNNMPRVSAGAGSGGPRLKCTGSCRGIKGYFTHWVPPEDVFTELGGPNLGAVIARLIK